MFPLGILFIFASVAGLCFFLVRRVHSSSSHFGNDYPSTERDVNILSFLAGVMMPECFNTDHFLMQRVVIKEIAGAYRIHLQYDNVST
jgi:hypothetical protein